MFDLVILLVLAWSFYLGYQRGLVHQIGQTILFLISFLIASVAYTQAAQFLSLWIPYANPSRGSQALFFESGILFDLDQVFYSGLGFVTVFTIVWMVGRILATFLVFSPWKREWDSVPASLISGGLSLLLTWFRLEMLIFIVATVPLAGVQDTLSSSFLVQFMMNLSPFSRLILRQLWVSSVLGGL
ncbi:MULTISPECIES: CvpA family protein [unclassified Streptococcus]|uniref:CvpA family protein n=1 Tax=unclassified Streptococcus TaxID=2608887 RepID=UPI0010726E3D|nr:MULTISPECIES: CvpA family protein [unclassified Streptococcus]MBF0805625.1 CvpA family protein [Streptococcus sp. 19428wA2_WM07]TFU28862.1 CvpA family protein [Streptococcus sp. WM07]